jgi:electron transport complex protein RnfC
MPTDIVDLKTSRTFAGGVHPHENKDITENKPVKPFKVPDQVSILLSQHIGAICQAKVAKRDQVKAGDVVGESDAFVSAPVHSPVNGTVKDIALKSHPVLGRAMAVVIDVDKENNSEAVPEATKFSIDFNPEKYDPSQIRQAIQQAGIVGMGGAGFPTRVKLEPNQEMKKDVMIINACECEPYITCDYRLMMEWTNQLIAGIKLAAKAAQCFKVKIGIENNKPNAVKAVSAALAKAKDVAAFEVVPLKTKYPQGGERQLIKAVTGKTVPTGSIPPQIGVVVLNVATCSAIAEAVVYNKPLTHRIVTVTGKAVQQPGNYYLPLGTSVNEVLDFCGGLKQDTEKVIMGGPMMGFALADMDTPVTKTSGSIIALSKKEVARAKRMQRKTACIRCGRCLQACPENLNPTTIAHAVKAQMLDIAKNYYMSACIECGCCSYVCPANIELTGHIKTGKILDARQKKRMPK